MALGIARAFPPTGLPRRRKQPQRADSIHAARQREVSKTHSQLSRKRLTPLHLRLNPVKQSTRPQFSSEIPVQMVWIESVTTTPALSTNDVSETGITFG
jgi:hypothetical protein